MPGIAGVISKDWNVKLDFSVDQMTRCMLHEKHHVADHLIDHKCGVGFGWVRNDNVFSEKLAFWGKEGGTVLLISGENYQDSYNPLQEYERVGLDFLSHLNGWFSGILVDSQLRKITLFNDRYGLGRIYFHQNNDGFFFASEAKSLLTIVPGLRQIDSRGLAEWLTVGCVMQNRTLFPRIALMPGGSAWSFGKSGQERASYFKHETLPSEAQLEHESFNEELSNTFPKALKRCLKEDDNAGMSLTGGLDGRMVMAWIKREPDRLPCYTFNSLYRDCADVRVARKVALQCRQPHQTITIGKEFLREFPKLAEQSVHISDGTMDVTGSVEIYANRIARGIAPVRITGNYGSELLRSNVAFRPSSLPREIFCQEISDLSNLATKTYKEETKAERLSFIAYKQVPWHHFGRFSIEQSQLRVQSPFLDNELVRLLFRAPQDCIASVEPTLRLIARGNPALARIPTDRGIKWPAARIMNSLRHSYHDLWARSEYAYDYGMPRWLTSVDRRLALLKPERFFLGRQKFCHFRVWYKNELSAFIKEVLLDPRSLRRAYVNPTGLTQALGDHLSGRVNHTNSLHKLLSMELFHRKFIDQ